MPNERSQSSFFTDSVAVWRWVLKHLLIVVFLGGFLSLILAWSSVLVEDFNPATRELNGSFRPQGRPLGPLPGGYGPESESGHAWKFRYDDASRFGVVGVVLSGAWLRSDERSAWDPRLGDPVSPDLLPRGSKARVAPTLRDQAERRYHAIEEIFAGWPMTAWKGEVQTDTRTSIRYRWCISYTKRAPDYWGPSAVLPYRPLWFGLMVNSLVFGVPAYFAFLGLRQITRWRRKRKYRSRGQCELCGYNITGLSTCPECGQPVVEREQMKGE